MIAQPEHQATLFVFNDNEEKFLAQLFAADNPFGAAALSVPSQSKQNPDSVTQRDNELALSTPAAMSSLARVDFPFSSGAQFLIPFHCNTLRLIGCTSIAS